MSETLPPGTQVYYCIEGQNAMDGNHPIYLRASSNTFQLRMLDLIKQEVDDSTGILDAIQESDFKDYWFRFANRNKFGQVLLQDMIPTDLLHRINSGAYTTVICLLQLEMVRLLW